MRWLVLPTSVESIFEESVALLTYGLRPFHVCVALPSRVEGWFFFRLRFCVCLYLLVLFGVGTVVRGRQSVHRRRVLGITQRVVATTHATPGKGNVSVVRITLIANRSVGVLSSGVVTVIRRRKVGFFLHSTSGVLDTRYVMLVNAHRRTRKLGYKRYKCTAYTTHARKMPYTLGDVSMNVTVNSTYTATTSVEISAHIVFSTKLTTRRLG